MTATFWLQSRREGHGGDRRMNRRKRRTARLHRSVRLPLEMLEDRTLLSTFVVSNLGDAGPGSLRQAILSANNHAGADVICFAARLSGTIALSSELSVTDDLRINGPGACRLTVSGQGITRVFDISGNATHAQISDLTIANGLASGATVMGLETDNADGFVVVQGGADTLGGGILNSGACLTLSNVTLTSNRADASLLGGVNAGGGAIANIYGATLSVVQCNFYGNQATAGSADVNGGAILNEGSTLTVKRSTFVGNQVAKGAYLGSGGGAIANLAGSQATVQDSDFRKNVAIGGDGADGAPGEAGGNGATGYAGAIANLSWGFLTGAFADVTLTVSRSTFVGNEARGGQGGDGGAGAPGGRAWEGDGGAVAFFGPGSVAVLSGCQFISNRAIGGDGGNGGDGASGGDGIAADGGAIDIGCANVTITDSSFVNNQAYGGNGGTGGAGADGGAGDGGNGGAICSTVVDFSMDVMPTLVVQNCTFMQNRGIGGSGGAAGTGGADGGGGISQGGALAAWFGTIDVSRSLFLGNQVVGGTGASGGFNGAGVGGAICCGTPFDMNGTGTVTDCLFIGNVAHGGAGTAGSDGGQAIGGGIACGAGGIAITRCLLVANQAIGGTAGAGGTGGPAFGGGLYNVGPSTLTASLITANKAVGGAPGSGGTAGTGMGGGIFNDVDFGGTLLIDPLTAIFGNQADLFPNCYGCE